MLSLKKVLDRSLGSMSVDVGKVNSSLPWKNELFKDHLLQIELINSRKYGRIFIAIDSYARVI